MESKALGDNIFMMGIDRGSYEQLLEIAKREGKSVVEIASEALKTHIEKSKHLKESKEKKLLMEG